MQITFKSALPVNLSSFTQPHVFRNPGDLLSFVKHNIYFTTKMKMNIKFKFTRMELELELGWNSKDIFDSILKYVQLLN